MSSTLAKIADKLTGKDKHADNHQSSNIGPHSSAVANKLDPRVDSDADGRNNPTSHVGSHGQTQHTAAHPTAGYSDTATTNVGATHVGGDNYHSTNTGPHNSNLANKLDPRVDSTQNQYTAGTYGGTHTGTHHPHQTTTTASTGGYTGTNTAHDNPQSTNAGPHASNLLNKLDPRVDSDRDGRDDPTSRTGGYGQTQTGTIGANQRHTTADRNYQHSTSTNVGPHSSNLLNKVDPRVDSDRDGRANPTSGVGGYDNTQLGATNTPGYGTSTHTASTGYHDSGANTAYNHSGSTNTGPHSNNLLNKLDPRVDSDRDGRNDPTLGVGGHHQTQSVTSGAHTTGGAQGYTGSNTAYDNSKSSNTGPHSSNLLNKLDPRIDSDRDGRDNPASRTGGYGHAQTTGSVNRY